MDYPQIIQELKNKIYKPVYFLCGEESFYIDKISEYIEKHTLNEEEKAFNQMVLYGKDTDIETIITTARRYPMMAPMQVLIIREAQNIPKIERLLTYLEAPMKTTVMVICYKYKTLDKRTKFAKQIAKKGVFFESKKFYDNKIPEWVQSRVQSKGYGISHKACMMLAEFLGNDLSKIDNELEKLMINLPDDGQITSQLIEENIGISKDFNNFELQNAIGKRNVLKANQIVRYFGTNTKNHPFVVTLSVLYNFFSKVLIFHFLKKKHDDRTIASKLGVNPYFLRDYRVASANYSPNRVIHAISLLREYDLKSKGVNNVSTPDGELLKELVYKVMH